MKLNFKAITLKSGMLAVIIYLLHVLIGGFLWKDYNHFYQPISDLTASSAPNRNLLLLFTSIYGVLALTFAFSFSVIESRKYHRLVFWGGISFVLMHIVSISYAFFPQDLPGSEPTFTGTMHLVVTAFIVPFTILSPFLIGVGFRKSNERRNLGNFSIVCSALIFLFGGLSGLFYTNHLPYFGLVERLNIATLQVWTFILSYKISR
jgi:Protein of unknown function (DUF998)